MKGLISALAALCVALLLAGTSSATPAFGASPSPGFSWAAIAAPSSTMSEIVNGPGVGGGPAFVWDAAAGYEVALGVNGSGATHTFKLVGTSWVELHAWTPNIGTISPGWTDLVYDSSDGYPVLLIEWGQASTPPLPPNHVVTWMFDGGSWSYLPTRGAPPSSPNYVPAVADPSDGYLILMGGGSLNGPANGMWGLHSGVWTRLPAVPTTANLNAVNYAYDSEIGKLLILGNFAGGGGELQDWTFHAGEWKNIQFSNRLYDDELQPTYDPAIPGLLAWGEPGSSGGCRNAAFVCLWLWKDGTSGFVNITSLTAPPLDPCTTNPIYDPALKGLICAVFTSGTPSYGLWEFT